MTVRAAASRLRRRTRQVVAGRMPSPGGEPRVFYGFDRLPALGEMVEGGLVKFQRLQDSFPNHPFRFNLLYVGSSSLPDEVEQELALARRRPAPVVLNQNGVAYPAWAGEQADALNARLRTVLAAADHVLYQSRFCKVAADLFLGEPRGPWEILHNAVDTQQFTQAAPPEGPPTLLLGGNQFQPYRLETALETLRALPSALADARLLVTGRTGAGADAAISRLGLEGRVELVGSYAQRDAPALYARAHLLLHTKVNDPCPNVVIEAMACGLPVVYADSGGTPELVGAEAGIGVPDASDWDRDVPPDPEALADAVGRVFDALDGYRSAARRRAEAEFDLRPWVERHRVLFAKLVS